MEKIITYITIIAILIIPQQGYALRPPAKATKATPAKEQAERVLERLRSAIEGYELPDDTAIIFKKSI